MLKVGDKAPLDLELVNQKDNKVKLRDLLGSYVVVYFYPKDETPGCTKQACGFRDANADIQALGVKLIGVSKDSPASHRKFIKNHDLNFELWSDDDLEMQHVFGVWVEKTMFGRKFNGTQRSTFVINPEGEVVKIWEKAEGSKSHAAEVLEYLKNNLPS